MRLDRPSAALYFKVVIILAGIISLLVQRYLAHLIPIESLRSLANDH